MYLVMYVSEVNYDLIINYINGVPNVKTKEGRELYFKIRKNGKLKQNKINGFLKDRSNLYCSLDPGIEAVPGTIQGTAPGPALGTVPPGTGGRRRFRR